MEAYSFLSPTIPTGLVKWAYNLHVLHIHLHAHTYTPRFPSLEVDIEKELDVLSDYATRLKPMVCDTVLYVNTAVRDKKKVVVEGANAAMLDIDFGKKKLFHFFKNSLPSPCM